MGKPTPRIDGRLKVTGAAKYTADVNLPGMLHAQLFTSPHAHARIKTIDTSAAEKYPGVKIGSRGTTFADGTTFPVWSYYGEPTGILGLRLFTNPEFDQKAKAAWNPDRYYNDPTYYSDPRLVRPYRVGMSCGFCHVGPNPVKPPADPENPKWENLKGAVGNQYSRVSEILTSGMSGATLEAQMFAHALKT